MPAVVVFAIAALAVTTARLPGVQPREGIFDVFARLAPRPASDTSSVALIDIDGESTSRLGPWPWPRSALARLVTAAEEAEAAAVVVTVPTEGPDPLSPEVLGRYWLTDARAGGEAARLIGRLPSTDTALAASASGVPTALGVAAEARPTRQAPSWQRSDVAAADWLRLAGDPAETVVALPAVQARGEVAPALRNAATPAVIGLPEDRDGRIRRTPLVWSLAGAPVPSAGFAPLVLIDPVDAAAARGRFRVGGPPLRALSTEGGVVPLDGRGEFRIWLPADLDLPSVPAWRVLEGGAQWRQSLRGRAVFIGQSVTPDALVSTPRGPLTAAALHAQLAEQLRTGAVLRRPAWSGAAEGFLALLLGALAVGAAIFLSPFVAGTLTFVLSAAVAAGAFFVFQGSGLLLDPLPPIFAMAGGQLAVFAMVVGNMLVRDDAVRGAFHGALPPATMERLQARGGAGLLRGTRREVTVLACALRLPDAVVRRFEGRPDDFVGFMASANDALRRTILSHQGTVDHAENGQLLAYWNVPETSAQHVEQACACALKMIDDVSTLSENVTTAALAGEASVDPGFAELAIEVGIASGPCFAGPVGIGARNRYAVLGEAVTLATRLRSRSGLYGPAIITDDVVFDTLRHHYAFLDLDVVKLSEKSGARSVHGLVGNPFLKASKSFRQLADAQRELLLSWKAGDLSGSLLQLQRLRALPGVPEAYVALFEERIAIARAAGDAWEPADILLV
nr:adenylate/guanylate cyclase domain-containing protein [Parvularcula dongshanensis]